MCDCETSKTTTATSLHEKFCRLTHGIPCRTVAAIKALILGRKAENGCGCGGHTDEASSCGCGGHAKPEGASGGCGCGGKH